MGTFSDLVGVDTIIKGLDHVVIVVSNMDRSLDFYGNALGLIIHHDGRKDGGDKKSFLGTKSSTLVVLMEDPNRGKGQSECVQSIGHLAFSVDNVEKVKEELRAKGIKFIEVKADKAKNTKAYHFLDPDGLELEIYGEVGQKAVY